MVGRMVNSLIFPLLQWGSLPTEAHTMRLVMEFFSTRVALTLEFAFLQ